MKPKNWWKPLGKCTNSELFEEVNRRIAKAADRRHEPGTPTKTDARNP